MIHSVIEMDLKLKHENLTPFLNFYSQADPCRFRHVDGYSLKLNFVRTTKFKYS